MSSLAVMYTTNEEIIQQTFLYSLFCGWRCPMETSLDDYLPIDCIAYNDYLLCFAMVFNT